MTQTFFVWPHGGKSASIVGTFNHWNATPLTKQGNYFFTVVDIPDGIYSYKFVVDGRWVYDISQPHEDDGSGNWNNYVEVGEKQAQKESAPGKHQQQQQQQQGGKADKQQQKQQQKEQRQQKQPQQQQEKGGKAEKQQQEKGGKAEKQQQQQQEKGGKSEKQQQQQQQQQQSKKNRGKQQPEPKPETEPEQESAPAPEPEAEQDSAPEPEQESAPAPAVDAKKEKAAPVSIVTLEVVGSDVDTDMAELEKFVRSIERPGLKWEGSSVSEHVFGLKKLEIILQAKDDVAIEDDILIAIRQNEDLIGNATILNFSC